MVWKGCLLGSLLAFAAGLSANEAVTLVNPDFEKGTTGWGGHGTQPKESAERAKILTVVPGEKPGEEDADPGSGLVPLGDMCISLERATAQAKEFGHTVKREVGYLTIHSMLHLLGYDHINNEEERKIMREKEEHVLTELGLKRNESYYMDSEEE